MKKNDLFLHLICIVCVAVLFCSVLSGCQLPGKEPQATEAPTGDPTGPADDPSGPADDPSGPADDPSGPADDPSGPADDPVDEDSSLMDGDDHIQAPW